MARIVVLTEGRTNPSDAKTACGLIRYRRDEVVALLDSTQAGRTAQEVLKVGGAIPIVDSLEKVEADTLVIGIAPAGGNLPAAWKPVLRRAIEKKLTIINGLHYMINDDPEFRDLAAARGVKILDVRRSPDDVTVSKNAARDLDCYRVHTVGNDCNAGKMSSACEIDAELRRRGRKSEFIPTGQTGIMIAGWGIAVDRVISDFVAGATEAMVLSRKEAEFQIIEGQGSLVHPLYSGVTLSLLHGCAPQAMVMCYEAGRDHIRHVKDCKLPPLEELVRLYEKLAAYIYPSRVIAFCANTSSLTAGAAEAEIRTMSERLGIPGTDPYRFGCVKVADAVLEAAEAWKASRRS
jgi:uncharacterized NAD-dependent epimerase/dehydratase family protein